MKRHGNTGRRHAGASTEVIRNDRRLGGEELDIVDSYIKQRDRHASFIHWNALAQDLWS